MNNVEVTTENILAVLGKAEELVTQGWTQKYFARTKAGKGVGPLASGAVCWCALGAVERAVAELYGNLQVIDWSLVDSAAGAVIRSESIGSLTEWNDASRRTQVEVVAAFRAAREKLEAKDE